MFSVNDFVAIYENKTNEELIYMHRHIENYSEHANEAVNAIIEKRGGLEKLVDDFANKKVLNDEIKRIKKETVELGNQGVDVSLINTLATSNLLTAQSVKEIVDQQYAEVELELKDKEINPRTIVGSIIGGIIASVIGGILWGIQLIYTHAIFYLLLFGLILLCYGIIKISTKQSKKNNIVFIATIISVILAVVIGQLLYSIIGYRG